MTTMSPDLIAFLKAWHEWATNGAPELEPFSRHCGLCPNANIFGGLGCEMSNAFGGESAPFGDKDYWDRHSAKTQHECPKRLAWVRERLIEAGELSQPAVEAASREVGA